MWAGPVGSPPTAAAAAASTATNTSVAVMDIDANDTTRGTKRKRDASPVASSRSGSAAASRDAARGATSTGPGVFDPLETKRKMLHPLLLRIGDGQSSSSEVSKLIQRLTGLVHTVAGKDEGAWNVVWRILYDCAITLPVKVPIYAALASSMRGSPGAKNFVARLCSALADYAIISIRGGEHAAVDLVGGEEYRGKVAEQLNSERLVTRRVVLLRRYRVLQARYRARQILRVLAELSAAGAVATAESIAAIANVAQFAADAAAAAGTAAGAAGAAADDDDGSAATNDMRPDACIDRMSGAAALASAAAFALLHLLVAWQRGSVALDSVDVTNAEKVLKVCTGVADVVEAEGSSVALALNQMRLWRTPEASGGKIKSTFRELVLVAQSKLDFVGSLASATAKGGGKWQGVPVADARANGEDCFSCFGQLISPAVAAGDKLSLLPLKGLDEGTASTGVIGHLALAALYLPPFTNNVGDMRNMDLGSFGAPLWTRKALFDAVASADADRNANADAAKREAAVALEIVAYRRAGVPVPTACEATETEGKASAPSRPPPLLSRCDVVLTRQAAWDVIRCYFPCHKEAASRLCHLPAESACSLAAAAEIMASRRAPGAPVDHERDASRAGLLRRFLLEHHTRCVVESVFTAMLSRDPRSPVCNAGRYNPSYDEDELHREQPWIYAGALLHGVFRKQQEQTARRIREEASGNGSSSTGIAAQPNSVTADKVGGCVADAIDLFFVAERMAAMRAPVRDRLCRWFAWHLSQFGFKWAWSGFAKHAAAAAAAAPIFPHGAAASGSCAAATENPGLRAQEMFLRTLFRKCLTISHAVPVRAAIEAAHAAPVLAMMPDVGDITRNVSVLAFPEAQGSGAAATAVLSAPPPTFNTVAAAAASVAAAAAGTGGGSDSRTATSDDKGLANTKMPATPAPTPVAGLSSQWWDSKAQPALAALEDEVRGLKGEIGDNDWATSNAEALCKVVPLPGGDGAPVIGAPQTEAEAHSLRARLVLHAVLRAGLPSVAHFEARARRAARLLRVFSGEATLEVGKTKGTSNGTRIAVQVAMLRHLCSFFAHSTTRAEAAMRALLFLGVVRADAVVAYALSAAGDKEREKHGLFSASLHGELLLSALSVHDLRRSDAWRLAAEGLPPKPGDENEGITEAVVKEARRKLDVDEQQASAAFDALLTGLADVPAGDDREWIVESVIPEHEHGCRRAWFRHKGVAKPRADVAYALSISQ